MNKHFKVLLNQIVTFKEVKNDYLKFLCELSPKTNFEKAKTRTKKFSLLLPKKVSNIFLLGFKEVFITNS